jgi:hypothetical protein
MGGLMKDFCTDRSAFDEGVEAFKHRQILVASWLLRCASNFYQQFDRRDQGHAGSTRLWAEKMRHPDLICGNCQAYQATDDKPEMGYCHRESIKGHAIQEYPKIDLRLDSRQPQEPPKYKIVPSFPPTLARMWCMQIVPTAELHKKLLKGTVLEDDGENDGHESDYIRG